MNQFKSFTGSGLIDFLRESTEAALDLSKNLTAAQSPGEFFHVWTKFAEEQFAAAQKYSYQLTAQTLPTMDMLGAARPPAPALTAAMTKAVDVSKEQDNAALLSELDGDIEALKSKLAALIDRLTELESRPLKIKFSFGEPPHTGWTPSKVVVLGNDAEGRLVQLPSTIEPGGFRYTGAPSFWIAID
jgi:Phasin protein